MIVLAFLAGIVFWTFMEYVMHRFLGHVHKGGNFFKAEHGLHHSRANYFAPVYKKLVAAAIVFVAFLLLLNLVFPLLPVVAFLTGLFGMYGFYEYVHFRYHSKDPVMFIFVTFRKHHFYHHFHNPKVNHGVTTRFWDRVFGTFVRVEKVRVPKKMSMQWLLDGDTIKDIYATHFSFSGNTSAT